MNIERIFHQISLEVKFVILILTTLTFIYICSQDGQLLRRTYQAALTMRSRISGTHI
jgi:hypothetical protein